jgi:hypothetical protein
MQGIPARSLIHDDTRSLRTRKRCRDFCGRAQYDTVPLTVERKGTSSTSSTESDMYTPTKGKFRYFVSKLILSVPTMQVIQMYIPYQVTGPVNPGNKA